MDGAVLFPSLSQSCSENKPSSANKPPSPMKGVTVWRRSKMNSTTSATRAPSYFHQSECRKAA